MGTTIIRDTIKMAKIHEQKSGHLANLFKQYEKKGIHIAIRLPGENAVNSLVNFVIAYIEHVPKLLDATSAITKDAKIDEYSEPFLQLAIDYFLNPPKVIANHVGLEELMDEAYLAHRLMEEVNDYFMIRTTIPLVPFNMTMPNIIVHSLIGEPFANKLDKSVQYTVERAMMKVYVYNSEALKAYINQHKNNQWDKEQYHWPCLTDKLSIDLRLPYQH